MDLIDIGANLTHESFDHDRNAVLQRAREAGVVQQVVTGASREHSPTALRLAQAHAGELFATAGVHPHHATEYTDECDAEMRARCSTALRSWSKLSWVRLAPMSMRSMTAILSPHSRRLGPRCRAWERRQSRKIAGKAPSRLTSLPHRCS